MHHTNTHGVCTQERNSRKQEMTAEGRGSSRERRDTTRLLSKRGQEWSREETASSGTAGKRKNALQKKSAGKTQQHEKTHFRTNCQLKLPLTSCLKLAHLSIPLKKQHQQTWPAFLRTLDTETCFFSCQI